MKHLLVILISIFLALGGVALAQHAGDQDVVEEEKAAPEIFCPVTLYTDNSLCKDCHLMVIKDGKPKFGLKEIPLENTFSGKPYCLDIIIDDGVLSGYYFLKHINADHFMMVSQYLATRPEIKRLVIEIHSPGGSVMDSWRIVGKGKSDRA